MNFADFLRLRQQGNPPPPVGPFPGDRRMDQVEAQRSGVYPANPAEPCPPGWVCFEDGTRVPEGYAGRPGNLLQGDGTGGPIVYGGAGTQRMPVQRSPRQSNPAMGNGFLQFLLARMNGGQTASVGNYPSPSPTMDPRSVVCDENGQNCRPVYRR